MRNTRTVRDAIGLRWWLCFLLVLLVLCQIASAVEIGQTRQEIIARHGAPPLGDTPRGIAIYRWDVWRLEIQFVDETARKLTYTKTDPLSDTDIQSILTENGGFSAWRHVTDRIWCRPDGCSATLEGPNNRTLILQGAHRFIQSSPPPPTPIPLPPHVAASSTPALAVRPLSTAPPHLLTAPSQAATPCRNPNSFSLVAKGTPAVAPFSGNLLLLFLALLAGVGFAIRWSAFLGKNSSHKSVASPKAGFGAVIGARDTPPMPCQPAPPKPSADTSNSDWKYAPTPPLASALESKHAPPPAAQPLVQLEPASRIPHSIDSITWDQFEMVIAEIYRRLGYAVEISSGLGADGGVDVKLLRNGSTTLVQCKQWRTWKVSVKSIREFYGVLMSEGAQRGIFISTGEYTRDCQEFADGKPIELLSRPEIDRLVKSVECPSENIWDISLWIDQFVAGARIVEPVCPYCRKPMVLRHPKTAIPFWGCSTYPGCRGKREVRSDLLKNREDLR